MQNQGQGLAAAGEVARQMRVGFSSYFDSHIHILIVLAIICVVAVGVGWFGNVQRTKHDKEHSWTLGLLVMLGVLGLSVITTIFFNGLAARAALEQIEKTGITFPVNAGDPSARPAPPGDGK